ncbi:transient receptor potential cation channel subfamily M member-like 2 [Ptychodera flava]|uniref:transient receptor potential cation channel subfamily M member-like 2 n=1 Tax=Ptychodera flava TaxID=63121 RepID=UPI00396A2DE5
MVFGRLDDTFHPLDIFLHVWILSMFIETTREMFHLYKHGRKFNRWKHFKEWITSIGNLISLATILSLCIAFICRWFPCTRQVARIFYGINISFFILRILRLYTASKTLGPLVTMVKLMLLRTLKFSAIFVIFLSAYAVAVQAVVGQFAGQSVTFYAVLDVFYQAYFQTFGELFLDELPGGESQPQTLIATIYICFLAAYLFMGHLLMLNLLIALFNRDIDKVDEQSKEIWIFEHYVLHNQFSKRPALPEPLSLLLYVYYLAKYLYSKCCGKSDMENPNNDQDKKFMRECLNDYIMQEQKRQEFSYKDKFDRLEDLGEEIKEDVDHWSKKIKHGTKYINKAKKTTIGTESKLYNRLTDLERQVSKLESLVERIDEWDPNRKVSRVKRWLLPYIHPSMREGNEGYLPLLKKGRGSVTITRWNMKNRKSYCIYLFVNHADVFSNCFRYSPSSIFDIFDMLSLCSFLLLREI